MKYTRPIFTLIFIVSLLLSCRISIDTFQTSDPNKMAVKSGKFRGTIFKSTYSNDKLYYQLVDSFNRFTPSKQEIFLAEKILKDQIRRVNTPRINQLGRRQFIDKNLNKYFRQYVGFTNERGERVIYINSHWDRFSLSDRLKGYWNNRLAYTSDFSLVLDGGSRYWNVQVNLTTKILYGLTVNGVG